jgi:Ser/Thr protein kinase RdoA (MazF antagonist)
LRLKDPDLAWTLCHGDFHASNSFYLPQQKQVVFVDWSEVRIKKKNISLYDVS